ncbi:MAG: MFS transporter [Candidatus Helarchaeota archaeon]
MDSKDPKKNLQILTFAAFVRMLGISIIDFILVIYAISLGGDPFLSGIAVGMFSIAQVLFQIPVAKLSDRIGRKKTLLMGMTIYALGTFLCGISRNIFHLTIFRFIQGSGAYISVIQAFIGDLFPSEKRGRAMSYYQSGVTIGYAIGLPLGGFCASIFLNLPFFVNLGFILTSIILIYIFIDDLPPLKQRLEHNYEHKINYREDFFKNKLYLLTIFTDCFVVFVFSSLLVFIAPYAQTLGLETFEFSIIMVPLVFLMTFGFFLGGRYGDRVGRSNAIFLGLSIAGTFLLIQAVVSTPFFLILIAAVVIMGIGIAWPTIPALILDSVSEQCRATGSSIYNVFRYSANALGPIIMGYIIGIFSTSPEDIGTGVRISYIISGIIYLVLCIIVFIFLRRYEMEKKRLCSSQE